MKVLTIYLPHCCSTLTDTSILGHLSHGNSTSTEYLGSAGLAGVWCALSGVIIWQGFCAALTTLASQAWGAKNYKLVGVWLQIGLLIVTLACIPIGITWVFSGTIMKKLVGLEDNVADLVTTYCRVALIGFLPQQWYNCLNNYLIAQKIVKPQLYAALAVVGLNVAFNYLFIFTLDLGFMGSPLATATSRTLTFIFTVIFVFYFGIHKKTLPDGIFQWKEVSNKVRLQRYFKQALPLALTGLLEDGQLQLVSLFAARLGVASVATHQAMFQCFWFLSSFMVSYNA